MAKPLVLQYQGAPIALGLDKVDRSKLYGYVDTEVLDEQGQRCELTTLSGDGHTLVGRGGTALAALSPAGLWREKSALRAVDLQGNVITPVKSSFDAPIVLDKQASIDDYLQHNIHLVYRLTVEEGELDPLLAELKSGVIYTFPFSYRGGLEASAGFLLLGTDGNVFLTVGAPGAIEFVGLRQAAGLEEDEAAPAEEEDSLDFGMM